MTEASQTNGKAAINLQKLKLFKTLYVMVCCIFVNFSLTKSYNKAAVISCAVAAVLGSIHWPWAVRKLVIVRNTIPCPFKKYILVIVKA